MKQILLISVLFATAMTKITVRQGVPHFQLLRDDVADFDLRNVFDLSQQKGDVFFKTNVGKTFNGGEPYALKNYDILNVKEPNWIKAHDNWVVAVYDHTKIIFQAIDTDGKRFLHYQSVDLMKFGGNLVCTSSAMNHMRGYIYIGCMDKTSTESKPGAMYIFTYDIQAEKIVNEVSVKQDDGFRIVNRLEIFIESFPQDGKNDDEVYLIAYDQGHTLQKETRLSNHARVFFNVESGKLEFDTLVEVSLPGHTYDIIYDIYPYQHTLILTGRVKGVESIVTLCQCKLDLTKNHIACNPKFKPTEIQSGMAQIDHHKMTYHEVDIETKEIRYYQLQGKFTDLDWNTKLLGKMTVGMPKMDEEHLWIRGVHASQWGGVIYYGSVTHTDPGVTYIDWSKPFSHYVKGYVASVYDREFIALGKHQSSHSMQLIRDEPLYLVEGGYYSGHNHIYLTAEDEDGEITTEGSLMVLENVFDRIRINNSIGNIELQANEDQIFVFDEKDIIDGNGLGVEVKVSDESVLKAVGYTHAPVKVVWAGEKTQPTGDWSFSHNKALLVERNNSLRWGTCSDVSHKPITVSCETHGHHAIGNGNKLNSKVIAAQNLLMAWSNNTEKNTSIVYIMADDGEFEAHNFKGEIHDAGFMATKTFFYVFLVFDHERVEIWSLNKNDLKEFEQYLVLDHHSVDIDHFCPHAISIPPRSDDEYDILSDCGFTGKAVLRMGLTYNVNAFSIPLSMRHKNKGFCSFKTEFVINSYTEAYSISGNDTFNFWTVPMQDMDGAFSYEMHCLPTLGKVAYVAHGTKGLKNTFIEQNHVEHNINQGRRFPGFHTGIEAESVRVFELLDRIIYVVENEGMTHFVTTFDTPRIKFTAGSVQDEEDVTVTITVYNKGAEQTFLQLATVYPHQ